MLVYQSKRFRHRFERTTNIRRAAAKTEMSEKKIFLTLNEESLGYHEMNPHDS